MANRVCVIGAGIIGTSTALSIVESIPDVEVTLMADKFSPDTTSDGIGGLWLPYLAGSTPQESILKWGSKTFSHLLSILRSSDADMAGVHMRAGSMLLDDKPEEDPFWKDTVFHFKDINQKELEALFPDFKYGWSFTTLFCLCNMYIPWLMKRYQAKGGKVIKQSLSSLSQIADLYDVIVICTGLGSRHLVGDKEVYPIRGQLVTVKSLWMNFVLYDKGVVTNYLIPGSDYLYLGGTAQVGDWNDKSDPEDVKTIIESCSRLVPSIKGAKVISSWAGLRPARSSIRLEKETMQIGAVMKKIVHNYGHGGSGATLHWGCAQDATELVRQSINEFRQSKL